MKYNPLSHLTTAQKKIAARVGRSAVVAAALCGGAAFADGTDAVSTAITTLQSSTISNIGIVVTAAFAVLVASLVPDIGLGLAKKWIKKGAS